MAQDKHSKTVDSSNVLSVTHGFTPAAAVYTETQHLASIAPEAPSTCHIARWSPAWLQVATLATMVAHYALPHDEGPQAREAALHTTSVDRFKNLHHPETILNDPIVMMVSNQEAS